MPRFRRLITEIEAEQVTAAREIVTANGPVMVLPSDWIVYDSDGKPYPIAHSVFQKTYAPIDEAPTEKTLHNSDISGARKNVPDIKVFGDGDAWKLICKASSEREGWMKSTKVMEVPGLGVYVQVTTQQKNLDGTYAVAESVAFAPGACIEGDGEERRIVKMNDGVTINFPTTLKEMYDREDLK